MKYDELLDSLGQFGTYQKFQYFLVCLVSITSAFHAMNMVFVGAVPEHHCHVEDAPGQWQNLTWEQQQNVSIPWEDDDGTCSLAECDMYNTSDIDWSQGSYEDWVKENRTQHECTDGWWYSQEYYKSTIVTEWDLVCDYAWVTGMASTIFFFGRFVGAFVVGILSDKYGRRPVFFISLGFQVLVGCVAAMSPSLWFFLCMYFLQGMFQVMVYLSSYVLGTEVVGPDYRKWAGMCVNFFYAIGQMILTLIAWGIRDWRWILITISLPSLFFFIYYWFLPESIRWLMAHGHKDKAQKVLETTARVNKKEIPENVVDELEIDTRDGESKSMLDLVRGWAIAKISINVWFSWTVNALVYYGLNLNSSNLHGDPYANYFLLACVEIPALLVALPLLDVVGRRWLTFAFMMLAGAACFCVIFVPNEDDWMWLVTLLSLIGKFGITGSYAIVYLVAAEVFPTVVRNNGMGVASMCARVGGMVAPLFLYFDNIFYGLCMMLFGILSIIGGILVLFLPETAGKPLPQNLEEMGEIFNTTIVVSNTDDSTKEKDNKSELEASGRDSHQTTGDDKLDKELEYQYENDGFCMTYL